MSKSKKRPTAIRNFKFKRHAIVGAIDAIEDREILKDCFIDTGELEILRDTSQPQCIILGRTGAGKTALLEMLCEREENVIQIAPESLALTYLSNNGVLKFYLDVGVDMELFFRYLWRHIFVVEILRAYFDTTTEGKTLRFIDDLKNLVLRSKAKERARDYLVIRGQTFWKETDYRVVQYTTKLEQEIGAAASASLEAAIPGFASGKVQLNPSIAKKLTDEQKGEIAQIGQTVVDRQQMQEMSEVMNLLRDQLLYDKQKRSYITIDRLDEKWVNDDLRYRLLRALLETVRDFNHKLPTTKLIVAIREDLLMRVFRYTRRSGDQEEKYTSLYLNLSWKPADLEELLDCRVNQLIRHQYTTAQVRTRDLLPATVLKKEDPLQFILDRTMLKPRDVIDFFNKCIAAAEGKAAISQASLLEAEGAYSESRLRALADEWSADYPTLLPIVFFLKKQKKVFRMEDIDIRQFENFMLEFWDSHHNTPDSLFSLVDEKLFTDATGLLHTLLKLLYKIGFLGVKKESYLSTYWSYADQKVLEAEFDDEVTYYIHPAFWRVLGIPI